MTDVRTSAGVIAGIGIVAFTGWNRLDPVVALLVAFNIIRTGVNLLRRSVRGLMDASLPQEDYLKIESIMAEFRSRGVDFHALRTRQAAAQRFISVHMLVPGCMTVHDAHPHGRGF
jgi:cation diffusion facilitator family transporter